jgi:Na+-transporting NADH:ubiquinone oxidoreductase subunit NqrB
MNIKLWQVGIFVYGVVYFVLACAMEAENFNQSYPVSYVLLSMIAQTLLVGGIFLFAFEASANLAKLWRWLFPLLVLEFAVGIVFDATVPTDALGAAWFVNLLFDLWVAVPAYYFNFRLARYRG